MRASLAWSVGRGSERCFRRSWWGVCCCCLPREPARLCVISSPSSDSEAVPWISSRQCLLVRVLISNCCVFSKIKQMMGRLDGSAHVLFRPLCASFQAGFEMSRAIDFQVSVFSVFNWMLKFSGCVVMAVETPPGHGYSSIDWTTEILFLAAGWTPQLWKIPFQVSGFTLAVLAHPCMLKSPCQMVVFFFVCIIICIQIELILGNQVWLCGELRRWLNLSELLSVLLVWAKHNSCSCYDGMETMFMLE